ncbi:alpha/beta hydrolase [Tichowtungia aerotolerans]|uniref:Carboxylesterase family protein n=1 Tax=Tichowtungia aerotolerans TaxID=2697043 RepID=A0A6P1MD46_9BACT|nr:alpha/beta hydrolase [Tichowtungia aerotolerans]QHI69516.1 carboxylesterase family protein [Tichowtungia aerotolerans]
MKTIGCWIRIVLLGVFGFSLVTGAAPRIEKNIFYPNISVEQADTLQTERCRLDVYVPEGAEALPVVVWFHGGGMKTGDKYFPNGLQGKNVIIVAVNYRLSPKVKCPVYIQDAAAAVAWTFKNIEQYGGDPEKIFVSGFSAGGYLTAMVGIDPQWLGAHGIRTTQLAGIAPISGMMSTHFTVRSERGDTSKIPVIDEFAPIQHCTKDAPPVLFITGDRNKDWPGRMEENQLMAKTLKIVGHPDVTIYELEGLGHSGGQEIAACPIFLEWIQQHLGD